MKKKTIYELIVTTEEGENVPYYIQATNECPALAIFSRHHPKLAAMFNDSDRDRADSLALFVFPVGASEVLR